MRKMVSNLFWFFFSGIVYTYFGYPIIVFFLSKLFPKKREYQQHFPSTTLLIAAYNEEKVIADKIQNCLGLTYPKELLQILIVADGSDDNTVEIIRKYSKNHPIELLYQPERRGKMAAINRAISFVRGEIIVFSDANNFYHPDTLLELVRPFSDPMVGAVSGAKLIATGDGALGESESLYWKYESMIKESEDRFSSCTSAAAEVLACRVLLYQAPPDHIINDDFYQIMGILREGYRVAYAPNARSYEKVSPSAEHEVKRRARIIAGRFQAISLSHKILPFRKPILVWQIISHKFLRPLIPFSMIGIAVTNILALISPKQTSIKNRFWHLEKPYGVSILFFQILFYTLAIFGNRIEKRRKLSKVEKLLYLPTFLVNSNIAALRGFIRFVRGQQTTLWERVPRE